MKEAMIACVIGSFLMIFVMIVFYKPYEQEAIVSVLAAIWFALFSLLFAILLAKP